MFVFLWEVPIEQGKKIIVLEDTVLSLNNTINKITTAEKDPCGKACMFHVLQCSPRTDARPGTQWMPVAEKVDEECFHKTTRLGTPVAGAKFLRV